MRRGREIALIIAAIAGSVATILGGQVISPPASFPLQQSGYAANAGSAHERA